MMRDLINLIQIEFIKTKRTNLYLIILVCSGFIPGMYLAHYYIDADKLIPEAGVNPWNRFFFNQASMIPIIMSFFVVVLAAYLAGLEHKANALKQIFIQPISRVNYYFSKLLVGVMYIFITYFVFVLIFFLSGSLAGFLNPQLRLLELGPNYLLFIKIIISSFFCTLGVFSIQFWLSFNVKNILVPLGFGICFVIAGVIMFRNPDYGKFFPYTYNILNHNTLEVHNPEMISWVSTYSSLSVIWFMLFLIIGCVHVLYKQIR